MRRRKMAFTLALVMLFSQLQGTGLTLAAQEDSFILEESAQDLGETADLSDEAVFVEAADTLDIAAADAAVETADAPVEAADEAVSAEAADAAGETADAAGEEKETEIWKCSVCGYIHEGPLPEDFRCPVCTQPASKFVRVE